MDLDPSTKELTKQASEAVSFLSGDAALELRSLLGQNVALWRFKNAVNIAIKAKAYLDELGIQPQSLPVQLRNIVPILEYGSYDDDPVISDMWAKLLTSYAIPEFAGEVAPKYHELLIQLSPSEAAILDHLYSKGYIPRSPNYHYVRPCLSLRGQKIETIIQADAGRRVACKNS